MNTKNFTAIIFIVLTIAYNTAICIANPIKMELKLWYNQPALIWEEALPIGNGRLGAMIYGGKEKEDIQFNEETLWTGGPHEYSHKGAFQCLQQIRELIWDGKQKEAETLAMEKFMSIPIGQKNYQPFGDLWIEFQGQGEITDYRCELDLSTAVCRTTYKSGGNTYTREYLASSTDQAIVINLKSRGKSSLTFVEMLMQSHFDAIDLLPALPTDIPDGHVRGMRARGGSELEFNWKNGQLVQLKVHSTVGSPLTIRYGNKKFACKTLKGQVLVFDNRLSII